MKLKLIRILSQLVCLFWVASGLAAAKPEWVHQRPQLPDYYVGIGVAEKNGSAEEYRRRAKNDALFDLAQEISVSISGTFVQKILEKTDLSEKDVRSEIRIAARANICGHELAAQWEDKKSLWVYYRLSKKKHDQLTSHRRRHALKMAADMFLRAQKAGNARQIVSALRFDYEALLQLKDFLGEPLEVDLNGRTEPLVNAVYDHLQQLHTGIRLSPPSSVFPIMMGQTIPDQLSVNAEFFKNNHTPTAVAQLPLAFKFPWRPKESTVIRHTDRQGIASCGIESVETGENGKRVVVVLDFQSLYPSPGILLSALLERLDRPQTAIALQTFHDLPTYLWHRDFNGRKVAIFAACETDGRAQPWTKISDELMQHLRPFGAQVVFPPKALPMRQIIAMAAEPARDVKTAGRDRPDIVIIITAVGKLNRRENPKNPLGEEIQFAGEFRTIVKKHGMVTFSDRFRAVSGWNPMGAEMCMEVVALNLFKRWSSRYLKHIRQH